jgi:hypothetical protein
MAIDFYISRSLEDVDLNTDSVALSEELQTFIYRNRILFSVDVSCIYDIDVFGDTVIDSEIIAQVVKACGELERSSILNSYTGNENAKAVFAELKTLCELALSSGQVLVSIGD